MEGKTGELSVIIFGPMFSGKSTELRRQLTTAADVGMPVVYINHSDDIRTSDNKTVRDGISTTHHSSAGNLSDKITQVSTDFLKKVSVEDFMVIGIDEGQFFPDLVEMVRHWVINLGKRVLIASLDADFQVKPFGKAHKLICLSQSIIKMNAICMICQKAAAPGQYPNVPAAYTWKLTGGNQQKEIGGADKYVAVCFKCHPLLNT